MNCAWYLKSLAHLTFPEAAKPAADLGLAALEIGTGNWNTAPHLNFAVSFGKQKRAAKVLSALEQNGCPLAALNYNGNQLQPTDGER